jgi:hypothetical protein
MATRLRQEGCAFRERARSGQLLGPFSGAAFMKSDSGAKEIEQAPLIERPIRFV